MPEVDLNTIKNIDNFELFYHGKEDTLFLRPAVSLDWNGEFWIRFDPKAGEIVGIEIDAFEKYFLKIHPELMKAWNEVKPNFYRRKTNSHKRGFIHALLKFLQEFLRNHPQQIEMKMIPA